MHSQALVVIDIQNDITKNYRTIIDTINDAIDWSVSSGIDVIYIKHNNLSEKTRTFKPGTTGEEFAPELKVVSDHVFTKSKASALTCQAFVDHIEANDIDEFYVAGADATGCVKSTSYNMRKRGYTVHVISDAVTSYSLAKVPEMLAYYAKQGCDVKTLDEYRKG